MSPCSVHLTLVSFQKVTISNTSSVTPGTYRIIGYLLFAIYQCGAAFQSVTKLQCCVVGPQIQMNRVVVYTQELQYVLAAVGPGSNRASGFLSLSTIPSNEGRCVCFRCGQCQLGPSRFSMAYGERLQLLLRSSVHGSTRSRYTSAECHMLALSSTPLKHTSAHTLLRWQSFLCYLCMQLLFVQSLRKHFVVSNNG